MSRTGPILSQSDSERRAQVRELVVAKWLGHHSRGVGPVVPKYAIQGQDQTTSRR